MKKQLIILLIFSIQASAQNAKFPVVKILVPCSDEFINNYNGKWLIHNPNFNVPQFFVFKLSWSGGKDWSMNFKKVIEERFPIEKLQALIDK